MSSTITLPSQPWQSKTRGRQWFVAIVLMVAAVVATIALLIAAFGGSAGSDAPVKPVSTSHAQAPDCVPGHGYRVC